MWKARRNIVLVVLLSGLPMLLWAKEEPASAYSAGEPHNLFTLLPESGVVGSWDRKTTPTLYSPENLWEYIDGAAEHYLSYGFQQLATVEYALPHDPKASVVIEIYDMGDNERGFGIYSSERQPDDNFVAIGTQGYLQDLVLNFYAGRYYAKLSTFEVSDKSKAALKAFATEIARRIKEQPDFPAQLEHLPASRIPNSEKMIYRNFLGQPYLVKVWLADCKISSTGNPQQTVTLFWTSFSNDGVAHEAFQKMKASDISSGQQPSALDELGDENFWIATKYHGVLVVVRKGSTLFGGYDFKEAKSALPLLKEIH
jgi:hypothetical protein